MGRANYALMHTIFYRGLEHSWIWVSAGVLEAVPRGYQGTTKVSGESKVTCGFQTARGVGTPTPALFRVNCLYGGHVQEYLLQYSLN